MAVSAGMEYADKLAEEFPTKLFEITMSYQASQIIFMATRFGIFDQLEVRRSAEDVAKNVGIEIAASKRLLNACVCLGLVQKHDTDVNRTYSNTPCASSHLVRSSKASIVGFIQRMRNEYAEIKQLEKAVERGYLCPDVQFTVEDSNLTEENINYNNAMMTVAAPILATAFDLSRYISACDLAGGIGGFGRELKKRYPTMDVFVMEQPAIVVHAIEQNRQNGDGESSITFIKGDIFKDNLPAVELFSFAHICMYLDDEGLLGLLARVYEALPPGGGLLICETILNSTATGPLLTTYRDVGDLRCAYGERTAEEYIDLLTKASFVNIQTHCFKQHICYDIVYARKPK